MMYTKVEMLTAIKSFLFNSSRGGVFINSCFAHCQSESQDTWFALDSPQMHNEVRNGLTRQIPKK
ncbi:putative pectinacetylesterase/NOTUM [Helianthus annuus]|nr:putative pectinacetylesterase/NOTUM [Helianthus annuus]